MAAGPSSTSAAPPPARGPGAPQGKRLLGMPRGPVLIVGAGVVLTIGIIVYRRMSASSAAAQQAADASSTDTSAATAADTGTLQTEIADLQGTQAQDAASSAAGDTASSSQSEAQLDALQKQLEALQDTQQADAKADKTPAKKPVRKRKAAAPVAQLGTLEGTGGPVKTTPRRAAPAHVAAHHVSATRRK